MRRYSLQARRTAALDAVVDAPALRVGGARVIVHAGVEAAPVQAHAVGGAVGAGPAPDHHALGEGVAAGAGRAEAPRLVGDGLALGPGRAGVVNETRVHAIALEALAVVGALGVARAAS